MKKQCLTLLTIGLLLGGCASHSQKTESEQESLSSEVQELEKPESIEQALKFGNQALALGDEEKGLYYFTEGLDLKGPKDMLYLRIAQIHAQHKKYELAQLAYSKAAAANPDNMTAFEGVGLMALYLRHYPVSKAALKTAAQLDLKRQGKEDQIFEVDHPEKSTVDRYSPYWTYNSFGILYDLEQKHDVAFIYFKKSIQIKPDNAEAYNNAGYSCYLAGQWNCAELYFTKSITLDAEYQQAYRNLGILYVRQNKLDQAQQMFEKVEKTYEAYNDIGYVLMLEGDTEKAELFLNKAIDEAPYYYKAAYQNLKELKNSMPSN